jgi:acyl-CoA synthetase (AMP-forming)/AMP-acid ligase II
MPLGDHTTMAAYRDEITGLSGAAPVVLPAAPLMHGTGHVMTLSVLTLGGCAVTLPGRSLDPEAIWQACEANGVTVLVIVGDAFARPLLAALDAAPGRWDLSSLQLLVSSGVMWSEAVKERLLDHLPQATIFDSLGSSEAIGMAASYSSKGSVSGTARFTLGEGAVVVTEDGRRVEPGSGEIGRVGISGLLPVGYHKDEAKTAATFPVIDGVRYSLPGDWATVEADGTVTLLGRGSVCINTGGEKVFPEEVEEVLKTAGGVVDAVCVGVPDERFGQAVCAIVEPAQGVAVDAAALVEHVKAHLAHYKAPRVVLVRPSIGRAPNGKVDYKGLTAWAREQAAAAAGR